MNSNINNAAANNEELTLTFFLNDNGVPVADVYLGERRLLATTHPATVVAAMHAMGQTKLTVKTSVGSHTAEVPFNEPGEEAWPLPTINLRMQLNPRLYQFRHLAPTTDYHLFLQGLDLFAHDTWHTPPAQADEHLRAAHHHLPKDLISRPLTTRDPKGWKRTLKNRNNFIYFPEC